MSQNTTILEIIRIIAWPIVAIVLLCLLRKSVNALVGRINKAKIGSFIEFLSDNSLSEIGTSNTFEKEFEKYYKVALPESIKTEEKCIKDQLKAANIDGTRAIAVLISQLANANVAIKFLVVNSIIYDEQIKLLFFLNEHQVNDSNKFRVFYEKYNSKCIELSVTPITFDSFIGFLLQQNLLSQNSNGFTITDFGKEYLSYIIKIGRKLSDDELN